MIEISPQSLRNMEYETSTGDTPDKLAIQN